MEGKPNATADWQRPQQHATDSAGSRQSSSRVLMLGLGSRLTAAVTRSDDVEESSAVGENSRLGDIVWSAGRCME